MGIPQEGKVSPEAIQEVEAGSSSDEDSEGTGSDPGDITGSGMQGGNAVSPSSSDEDSEGTGSGPGDITGSGIQGGNAVSPSSGTTSIRGSAVECDLPAGNSLAVRIQAKQETGSAVNYSPPRKFLKTGNEGGSQWIGTIGNEEHPMRTHTDGNNQRAMDSLLPKRDRTDERQPVHPLPGTDGAPAPPDRNPRDIPEQLQRLLNRPLIPVLVEIPSDIVMNQVEAPLEVDFGISDDSDQEFYSEFKKERDNEEDTDE